MARPKRPIFIALDPLAGITGRVPAERPDAEHLAAAMRQVRALGAESRLILSDLWATYPEALAAVRPRLQRHLCCFDVQRSVTRQPARLLKHGGQALPDADRKELRRVRLLLLAGPEKQQRLRLRARAALAQTWELVAGSVDVNCHVKRRSAVAPGMSTRQRSLRLRLEVDSRHPHAHQDRTSHVLPHSCTPSCLRPSNGAGDHRATREILTALGSSRASRPRWRTLNRAADRG